MSDPYLELEAEPNPYLDSSIPERAGNAAKAGAQGVVTSVGQAISGAARTADTIREGSLLTGIVPGTAKPTLRQSRRAFEQAMNDPRYMAALTEAGDDPNMLAQAERIFGPKAKLDVIRTPIEEGRKMSAAESVAQQKRLDVDSPLYAFGKGLVEAGREVYATDPYLDLKPESKLTRSMGSTLPSVALSLIPGVGTSAAVTQYALSQSEDMAQEAIDAGRPDLAMQSATAGLFIGALSEGALGATARLGTILKNPTKLAALEGWAKANPMKARAMIVGVREAAQEGVEQSMQNVTASDVVGYDENRPWHRQVLEAMVLGGVGGSLFGLGGAGLQKLTQPKADDKAVALEELNRALDAFQAQPERVTTLDVAPPTIEGTQGELIPVPPAEAQPEILTPAQIMSREAVNAMAELRKLKEAAKQQGQGQAQVAGEPAIEERPAVTIEPPTAGDLTAVSPLVVAQAQPIASPGQPETLNLEPVTERPPATTTKKRPSLGPRPDGVPDILDAIAELGGIKAPGSQKGTAEYDGYAAAFNEGGPAAVLRGGSNRPDLLLQDLQSMGWKFQTIDDMYSAVSKASNARGALAAQLKAERTVRPEMVQRVQELYDAAKRGIAVPQEYLVEIESQLNQKELRTLKGPLFELANMAGVAASINKPSVVAPAPAQTVPPQWAISKPIRGTTGASIVGYQWRSKMGEKWSEREGGYIDARVSDWDNSDQSQGTGREIVHLYYVKHPDGKITTEGIRSAQTILGISETRLQSIAKKAQAEQAYAEKQEKLHFTGIDKSALPSVAEANRQYRKQNYSAFRSFEENEEIFNRATLYQKDGKFVRTSTSEERMGRFGWSPANTDSSSLAQAKADVREAWDAFKVVGIMPDPKADARKVFDLYKALFKLASAYVKEGMRSAADFAKKVGLKHDAVLDAAWNDAVAGKARTNPDELDSKVVSEIVEGFRDRKFSRRFAEDERVAPEIRQATGNAQYQEMPNALTVAEAFAVIQARGIAEAQALMMDETNALSPRVRATIGQAIILQTNHDYGKTGDDTVLDRAVKVAEWLTEYGTRLGQGVQAFAIWNKLTPDGMVRTYIRTVQKAQQRVRKENPNAKPGELKIPEVDPETAKRIRNATAEAQNKPEGFQRDEAMADVLGMIAKAKGISGMDLTIALWYANILSGYPSWLRNGMGNAGMLFAEAATHAVTRPQHVPAILTGLFHGIGVGVPQAIAVLRTGKQTGHRVGKIVESPRVLELVTFGRKGGLEGTTLSAPVRAALETPLAYPLNAWKYVFRIMSATDMVAFESAMEMHARFLAKELVRTGKADGRTYSQLLAQQAGMEAQARSQATAEGLTGITYRRRIAEIIQQQRPEALQSAAAQDALYATFNQHPRGVLGAIAGHISELSNQWSALRLVIPFTNIVSNVLNNTLDYTPWGYRRLFPSVMLKDRAGERLNFMPEDSAPVDYQLQAARATLGTIGLAAIWALTQAHKDDDDPAFDVTARGPDNPNDREGLKETGWKPYSVKVGNRWVSYQQSVLAPGMAWIGSLRDAQRLKKWTDMEDWSRFAYAGKAIGPAIMSQSFVSGLRDFLQDISDDYIDPNGPKFKFASRSVGTLVPAAVKAVDRVMDPTIYDSQRFPAALLRDIPFVRSSQLKPALNALGEPVRPPDNFLYNIENPDPVWELLARKQAFPSKPSLTMVIRGRPITPDEQYSIIESSGPAIRRRIAMRIPAYAVLPDEIVQKRIDDIVREERDNARSRLGLK